MAITYEALRAFARQNGNVKLYAPKAEITILKNGTEDLFSIIENATTFVFDGKEYTRADFERLLAGR